MSFTGLHGEQEPRAASYWEREYPPVRTWPSSLELMSSGLALTNLAFLSPFVFTVVISFFCGMACIGSSPLQELVLCAVPSGEAFQGSHFSHINHVSLCHIARTRSRSASSRRSRTPRSQSQPSARGNAGVLSKGGSRFDNPDQPARTQKTLTRRRQLWKAGNGLLQNLWRLNTLFLQCQGPTPTPVQIAGNH